MRVKFAATLLIAVVLACVGLGGCSDDDSGGPRRAEPPRAPDSTPGR
jgi:hypothetical protein